MEQWPKSARRKRLETRGRVLNRSVGVAAACVNCCGRHLNWERVREFQSGPSCKRGFGMQF